MKLSITVGYERHLLPETGFNLFSQISYGRLSGAGPFYGHASTQKEATAWVRETARAARRSGEYDKVQIRQIK
jgi:hypothetical protein